MLVVCVGGNANFSVRVGGNANFNVFRYQHVVIPNVKLSRWGHCVGQYPQHECFRVAVEYRLKTIFNVKLKQKSVAVGLHPGPTFSLSHHSSQSHLTEQTQQVV